MGKAPEEESYLQSRKWLLDAYDVAAATRPEACKVQVVRVPQAPAPRKPRTPPPPTRRRAG